MFPFFLDTKLIYVKFRKPKKPGPKDRKEWQIPNTMPILFGMDMCSFSKPLTITEGEIDTLAVYESGVTNVVSVPSGCENMDWVDTCWDWLERFHKIILCGDADEPGVRMVQTLARRLGEDRCAIVNNFPERPNGKGVCKDANEILFYYGPEKLQETIDNAEDFPIKGLVDLADVLPIDSTVVARIKTMIPALDESVGGLLEGGITILTGKTGFGKSTLNGLLLLNAIEQGYNVCAYSGELRKEKFQEWVHFQAAGSDYITTKFDNVRNKEVPFVPYLTQERIREYYRGKFYLFDNNEMFEENQAKSILKVFTMAARRYGCKLYLVDNMMTSLSDADEEMRAQAVFVNALKKFAVRYSVHVLIVAHPRKTRMGEQLRNDDVSGSSSIVNLADNAIVVEKPNLRITKNREEGVQRLIECCYTGDSRRIYQANTGDKSHFSWNKEGIEKVKKRADSIAEYGISMSEESQQPF